MLSSVTQIYFWSFPDVSLAKSSLARKEEKSEIPLSNGTTTETTGRAIGFSSFAIGSSFRLRVHPAVARIAKFAVAAGELESFVVR